MKISRVFSSSKPQVPFSRKRDSLFYIKKIQSIPAPSLGLIYRRYIKQSLRSYKIFNKDIGEYLFKLLQRRKNQLKLQHEKMLDINELINEINRASENKSNVNETLSVENQNITQVKTQNTHQPLKQTRNQTNQMAESRLIKLQLQKSRRQRLFTQRLLQNFQCMHYISNALQNSMDPNTQMDLKTKQQTKLIRICFNLCQFFTPSLSLRPSYQSLVLLDFLEDDMEYEVLSEKDKQFVRQVITKVCGQKKRNHTRYQSAVDYLKDSNAVLSEVKAQRIQIMTKNQRKKAKSEDKQQQSENDNQDEIEQQENDLQQQNEEKQADHNDQWALMSIQQRDQAIRDIFQTQNERNNLIQSSRKKKKTSIRKISVLFEVLSQLKGEDNLYCPNPILEQEVYHIVRKFFKLPFQPSITTKEQNSLGDSENNQLKNEDSIQNRKLNHKLLEDMILQNEFMDEFVNQKKIIIM